eukprot:scaffold4475_cov42-Attheya_sp.AAC.5
MAQEAGQCTDLFIHLNYPWLRHFRAFGGTESIEYQRTSPYIFKGLHKESGKTVLLKVWREGDEQADLQDIELEYKYHKLAQEHGVPVAPLVTGELLRSKVQGAQFHVLATYFVGYRHVPQDSVALYTVALVSVVNDLHEKTGLLHCDIKLGNVMWDQQNKSARLIDFGHAQLAESAKAYGATDGYEAPEILAHQCHTRSTDEFSVGRTLLRVLDEVSLPEEFTDLRHVAINLAKEEKEERWDLKTALVALPTSLPSGNTITIRNSKSPLR